MIRVFVVDDSPFIRKAITRVLDASPDCRVVGVASTGHDAVAQIPKLEPDVVTLDVAMPGMDGLATLKALLAWRPGLKVIMLSAHTSEGGHSAIEALAIGAVDFIDKASFNLMDLDSLSRELVDRIRVWVRAATPAPARTAPTGNGKSVALDLDRVDLCVIGASTGGPAALQFLLERLPERFPLPVAIVQHMPVGFTGPFAERLDSLCALEVLEASEGDRMIAGRALIAPAGRHLRINSNLTSLLGTESDGARHVPSVDVLMRSADRARPGRVLGILLTGMGEDGAEGMSIIHGHGGVTLAESEESCAVFGMPRAAQLRGAVDRMLSLEQIAQALGGAGGKGEK
jgi:two-component system chemotaxis response regulator CheB